MRLTRDMIDEMVAHARAEVPNECCGMVASQGGTAVKLFRTTNAMASPLRYEIEPREQLRVLTEIEDAGWELGAIYHSHVRSDPVPSQTDINLARGWPDPVYVIVGVAGEEPDVRAFAIVEGRVDEVELEVV